MSIIAACLVPHPPLIVPAVGRGREEEIRATIDGYEEAARRLAEHKPDTVVIFSPHATVYADYIHISPGGGATGDLGRFGAPEPVSVTYDRELSARLEALCGAENLPAGTLGKQDAALDHGTLVPLHFLAPRGEFRVLRIGPSGLPRREHYRFGTLLRRAAEKLGRRVAVVASGDLSHKLREDGPYGFAPEGPALDAALCEIARTAAFDRLLTLDETLCRRGAECGLLPLIMLAGTLDGRAVRATLHSYESTTGVGYAVASFEPGEEDPARRFLRIADQAEAEAIAARRAEESLPVRIARRTLESLVRTGIPAPLPDDLPDELTGRRAGVFVSIKQHGELRGCIGTIAPTQPSVAAEIRENAVSAGTRDPRFSPVRADELDALSYSVDLLAEPEPCAREDLDPARYGVIVEHRGRRGLLLPNLEGVDTVEAQIAIACNKAGIDPDKPYTLQRFEVVRYL